MSFLHTGIAAVADFPGHNPHDHALAHWAADIKNGGVLVALRSGGEATGGAPIARRNE